MMGNTDSIKRVIMRDSFLTIMLRQMDTLPCTGDNDASDILDSSINKFINKFINKLITILLR